MPFDISQELSDADARANARIKELEAGQTVATEASIATPEATPVMKPPENPGIVDPSIVARTAELPAPKSTSAPRSSLDTTPDLGHEMDAQHVADTASLASDVPLTLQNNNSYTFLNRAWMKAQFDPDPTYNSDAFVKRNNIAVEDAQQFKLADSEKEAQLVLRDMNQRRANAELMSRRHGFGHFVASSLTSIVDVDSALALAVPGGELIKASRFGRMAYGAAVGGATLAAGQTIGEASSTAPEWTAVPMAGFLGVVMGGALGAISRAPKRLGETPPHVTPEEAVNDHVMKHQAEFVQDAKEGAPMGDRPAETVYPQGQPDPAASMWKEAEEAKIQAAADEAAKAEGTAKPKPQTFSVKDLEAQPDHTDTYYNEGDTVGEGSTVGSAQLNSKGSGIPQDRVQAKIVQDAKTRLQQTGIDADFHEGILNSDLARKAPWLGRAVQRFHDALTASPLASDSDRLMRSGSAVAKTVAYDLMESPSGLYRNNQSAAMLHAQYLKDLIGPFTQRYENNWKEWARLQGVNHWEQIRNTEHRERFNREVIGELQGRFHDGANHKPHADFVVRDAADAHDALYAKEVEVLQGGPGQHAVHGSELLKPKSGYYNQRWVGSKFAALIQGGTKEKAIVTAVAEGYVSAHPHMSMDDAKVYAKAVVRRSMKNEEGVSASLIGILQQDGTAYLRQTLMDNGVSKSKADSLIKRLTTEINERHKAGNLKGRVDIDLRFTASNGLKIMDLMDTDIARTAQRRSRGAAGSAALARKGFRSQKDVSDVIDTILAEQTARGASQATGSAVEDILSGDHALTRQNLEDMFSAFTPTAGQASRMTSPWVSRLMKTTNLSLLSQIGMAQAAETSTLLASVGWKNFKLHAGEAVMGALHNSESELVKELKHMNVLVPEEQLFNPTLWNDLDSAKAAPSASYMQFADRLLNVGQRMQGWTSGFYAIRDIQNRIAVTSMADKIMRHLQGQPGVMSMDRLADIGLSPASGVDPRTMQTIFNYIKNGTVEFKDGHLHKLNLDKWNPSAKSDFVNALNRSASQLVQQAMIGETNSVFHRNGVAQLLTQLKSFPLLAIQKQALRNAKMADKEALMNVLYGIGVAGSVYTAKQVVNNNTDNLAPGKIMRGAFGMSNITGWVPMMTDPVAYMLGMDSLNLSGYTRGGGAGGPLSLPPSFSVAQKLLSLPRAAAHRAAGQVGLGDGLDNNDIRALQATPIIGQMYGVAAVLNGMKK